MVGSTDTDNMGGADIVGSIAAESAAAVIIDGDSCGIGCESGGAGRMELASAAIRLRRMSSAPGGTPGVCNGAAATIARAARDDGLADRKRSMRTATPDNGNASRSFIFGVSSTVELFNDVRVRMRMCVCACANELVCHSLRAWLAR